MGEEAAPRASNPVTRELPVTHDIQMPGYTITISPGILETAGMFVHAATQGHRYAVISDLAVAARYGTPLLASFPPGEAHLFTFAGGEPAKTRDTWARLTDEMAEAGLGRDAVVVALGGGIACDLAGFVAATFMRGIPVAHVPTTLLAMVDASIGGKTGVDIPSGKNLVGAFHQPAAVIVDPLCLATLPANELRAGMAEVLKHGVIADALFFERTVAALPALYAHDGAASLAMIETLRRAIAIKCDVVRRDEREGGLRHVLNFGHTIAHAIELVSHFAVPHGEAVAIGMVVEARIGEALGVTEATTADRIERALRAAGLPTTRPAHLGPGAVLAATRLDKKARSGAVRYALPTRIGEMSPGDGLWSVPVPDEVVLASLGTA
ncbi:MAG: 3-dehydroquinate synthase [Gemmatimonadetes bacterium]|nr:3-dehydroquinate synthase [Gemmatimonadota bacterium]